jgi:PKD repeat protein
LKKCILSLLIFSSGFSQAQIICIFCFDQNDSISQNVNNLLLNGGFEQGCGAFGGGYFCPNSNAYSCDITSWTCTNGGYSTYASVIDGNILSSVVEGSYAAYMGSGFCYGCFSMMDDTSCLVDSACQVIGITQGDPQSKPQYGGSNGLSIQQTVNGLVPGNRYILEFWAGGEAGPAAFRNRGFFALDIGFGNIYLRNKPSAPATADIGARYIVEFNATSTSHTIKFTNWGHICSYCTELVLDNVRLYTLAELSPSVSSCINLPTAIFSAPNHICPGTCASFINLSLNATSYLWTFPGASPSTSTDVNPANICYNTPGTYPVTLIASGQFGSDTITLNNYITVYPQPAPQGITQSGDTLFAIAGATSYQWYYNGSIVTGATDYFYIAQVSGDYNVVATDGNGCEVEAVIFSVIASAHSAGNMGQIEIGPNPVGNVLTIKSLKGAKDSPFRSVDIFNLLGEKIIAFHPSSDSYRDPFRLLSFEIDVNLLPAGMYVLEILLQESAQRMKFVKD